MLAGGGLVVANNACVDAEAEFYIVTPTSINPKMGTCQDSPFCPAVHVAVGPQATGDQFGCLIVSSGLIPRGKDDTNHPETNRIIVSQVDIEVLDGGGAVVDSFSRAVNGFVDPSKPSSVKNALLSVPILRTESATKFASGTQIVIGIIIKGRTTGGLDVETPEFYLSAEGSISGGCDPDAASCC